MLKKHLEVQGIAIRMEQVRADDYISLTDIAKKSSDSKPADTITNWLRNQNTLLYLQTWEEVHNPDFKVVQMHDFRLAAVENRAAVSPKSYIDMTNAIGLMSKPGKYGGGTFAHSEIALEFCTWLLADVQGLFLQRIPAPQDGGVPAARPRMAYLQDHRQYRRDPQSAGHHPRTAAGAQPHPVFGKRLTGRRAPD